MRKFVFGLLAVVGILPLNSLFGQIVFSNNDMSITKLEKNLWVIETSDYTTMYLIEGTEKSLLIDTGTNCDKLDSIIKLVTSKPLLVVITHAHGDHDGNIRFFKDLYMHPADTVLMNHQYNGKIHFVNDGDVFNLGGTQIEVSWMPAHTPGSIVLLDRKAGNCFSGDAFGSGQVWLQLKPLSSIKTYQASCRKMEKMMDEGIERIYCGHYPYVKKAFDKNYIIAMDNLAGDILTGSVSSQPYETKVEIGPENPMIATKGEARIVYDPENIK